MSRIENATTRVLRGPGASRLLRAFGIDPRRYWLLIDLFGQLSDRREMLNQLGRDGMTLKAAAWIYFAFAGIFSLLFILSRPSLESYFSIFLGITAFFLVSVLLSETCNSLVNPVEGLVLAHQPIDGSTYTAAKLTHLLRILLYLVPGLNAVPAFAGLLLDESRWFYPIVHMLAAFGTGLMAALLCCAVFGWLIRFVPAPRLKTAGQVAEMMPFLAIVFQGYIRDLLVRSPIYRWLLAEPAHRTYLALGAGLVAVAIVVFGIRSLSGDYLIRVSSIVHGGSAARRKVRSLQIGRAVAVLFGGQASRAGFEYVSRMMVRDWHFRRQLIPLIPAVLVTAPLVASGLQTNPFSGRFSAMHVIPHIFGMLFFGICTFLAYGSDHKGTWIFLLAPAQAFGGFARGVYALLWIGIVAIPHAVLFVLLAWFWGVWDAGLFVAYSVAIASAYLGLELRLVDGMPFGKQPETARLPFLLPLMIAGAIVIGIAVGLQHLLVFRSQAIVLITTVVIGGAAWLLTRSSLEAFEVSIRYNLGLVSLESGTFYKEVDV
jgi:hypothetical protein